MISSGRKIVYIKATCSDKSPNRTAVCEVHNSYELIIKLSSVKDSHKIANQTKQVLEQIIR